MKNKERISNYFISNIVSTYKFYDYVNIGSLEVTGFQSNGQSCFIQNSQIMMIHIS